MRLAKTLMNPIRMEGKRDAAEELVPRVAAALHCGKLTLFTVKTLPVSVAVKGWLRKVNEELPEVDEVRVIVKD